MTPIFVSQQLDWASAVGLLIAFRFTMTKAEIAAELDALLPALLDRAFHGEL